MEFRFEKYALEVDVETTRKAYEKLPLATEVCDCQGCENYLANLDRLPNEVLAFFASLGVDIKRPTEIFGSYIKKTRAFDYSGFYYVAGKITHQKEDLYIKVDNIDNINPQMVMKFNDYFSVWFDSECQLVPEDFPNPHFEIQISANLPWVLAHHYFDYSHLASNPISEGNALLVDKKTRYGFVLNRKYYLIFKFGGKTIKLQVGQDLFGRYSTGWKGYIVFSARKLIHMK